MTIVVPLYPIEGAAASSRPTMDDAEGLIYWIDTHEPLQSLLGIAESIGYGVWRDVFDDYYVVARYDLDWAEVLDRPFIDTWAYEPSPDDWIHYHKRIKELLSVDLSNALGYLVYPHSISYRIRKKGKRCDLYKVFLGS